jgi:hypothetical protein
MSKEITKAYILQEMQDKFKMRELEPEVFSFSEKVVPIYNIESHLATREIMQKDLSITGIGAVTYFTVPSNERWRLKAYSFVFLGISSFTIAGGFFQRGPGANDYMYMDLTPAQTVSYLVVNSPHVIIDPGDQIKVNIDGYTSPASLRMLVDVEKEEIR